MDAKTPLARIMKEKNLKDRGLAALHGDASHSAIRRWRLGISQPKLDQAIRLAVVLGVNISEITEGLDTGTSFPSPSNDERMVIAVMRALDLRADEVLRRMTGAKKDC